MGVDTVGAGTLAFPHRAEKLARLVVAPGILSFDKLRMTKLLLTRPSPTASTPISNKLAMHPSTPTELLLAPTVKYKISTPSSIVSSAYPAILEGTQTAP